MIKKDNVLKRILMSLSLVLLVALLIIPTAGISADATVTSLTLTCSSLQATGTSDAPYVTLYVVDEVTNVEYYAFFPVTGGVFNYTLTFPAYPAGTLLDVEIWGTLAPYTEFSDPNYWDLGAYYEGVPTACVPVPEDPIDVPGPGIPAGFELRTILCDVPVYNLPAGSPVGSDMLRAGQTWYVNPTPVEAADGTSWTEVFVSSYINPYIPTACVG